MEQPHWIDIPIIEAFDYFQGTLWYFLGFARTYGVFFGTVGLMWSAFRLVNSRIDMKTMWWESFYKFFVFLLLINFYAPATSFIAGFANRTGVSAGAGKTTVEKNLLALRNKLEDNVSLERQYAEGAADIVRDKLGVEVEPIRPGERVQDFIKRIESTAGLSGVFPVIDRNKRSAKQELEAYRASLPETHDTIWGERTLAALNSVLIVTNPEGEEEGDLTDAYASLDIWLPGRNGQRTNYISSGALVRVCCLSAQLLWEKSRLFLAAYSSKDNDEFRDEDGKTKNWLERNADITVTSLTNMLFAGILCIVIIAAGIFCAIQYGMCTIEFIIVQGIGAFFIPFYLFDGTKELPKKLIPVFTGFLIKMLVMSLCMMFVLNLFLSSAAAQISPDSGGMNWVTFAQILFSSALAFVLTSNAPKIAQTLLTGQPQLSMGEFVAAAGTLAAGALGARNLATSAASPAAAGAAYLAKNRDERRAAGNAAARSQEKSIRSKATEGTDTSTREGRRAEARKWKEYKKEHADEIKGQKDAARGQAVEKTREMQRENYERHGGAAGTAGRVFAHYTGAAAHPAQTLRAGWHYRSPQDGGPALPRADAQAAAAAAEASVRDEQVQEKPTDDKNGLPDSLTGGRRETSST